MANSEFIEIISANAKQQIVDIMKDLNPLIDKIREANNFTASTTPKGAEDNIKKLTADLALQSKEIDNLKTKLAKLNEEKKKSVTLTAKEKVENAILAKQEKQEAIAISDKSTAYEKLLAKQQQVVKNLRSLTVEAGKETDATRKLQEELHGLNAELLQAEQASKKYANGAKSLATPVLLFTEAQKKQTQAIKEGNAEKAKSNALISRQMTGSMVESVNAIGRPSESLKRMNDYYRELERTTAEEAKSVTANEKLNRAYVQLSASRDKAKNKLQDLIASQRASNAEIRQAQKEFDVLNKRVAAADKAVGRFSDANRHINGLTRSVGNLMAAFGVSTGLYLFVDIIKGIYETTKALQSMDLALKMVSETEMEFAKNKVFLTEVSDKWGLEIKSLQQTYTQFYTASKGLLSDQSIKETFEGIAKAGSIMGLSLEQQQAAFYAIDQMMSKGTVTAEELKKQLGNAMPGAIKAAAMAYKDLHPQIKTIQEAEKGLYADMKKGAIDSATYVPLIAKNFQKLYGIEALNEVNTMQSAQNRLKNGYTEWIKSLTSGNSTTNKAVFFVNYLAKNLSFLLNTFIKGTAIVGTYLGVTKLLNFATRQTVLITEAYAIAKNVLNARRTQEVVLTQRQIALSVLETAAQRNQTVSTVALTGATEGAAVATGMFNATLLANPIIAVISLIMAGVTAYLLLADSTDDATTELIKYEQAKRDAEKEAIKNVKDISKNKNALQERLEIEVRQLDRLRKFQKTANEAELKEINDRIKAKEDEIGLTKEKLKLEGINVKTKSKEASDKAYIASHKAAAERDSIELQRLKDIDSLNLALEKQKKYNSLSRLESRKNIKEAQENTTTIIGLKSKIVKAEKEIRNKNIEITRQNTIFTGSRPEVDPKLKNPIKNADWYDQQIKALNDRRGSQTDLTGAKGKKIDEEVKRLEAIRDKIRGEQKKGNGNKPPRERKAIDFTEDLSGIELMKAENERELAYLEQRMNNEETSFDDRLRLRNEFSLKSLEILDDEFKKENVKIEQNRIKDLKEVNRGLRNGDIKSEEEAEKQRVAIRNRTDNEIATVDIKFSEKWQSLIDADADYYKKIQRQKRDIADETASILLSIEKDKFDRIVKNEELGINYSLQSRQKAFDAYLALSRKELDLEHIKALARANPDEYDKINASYKKANIALNNLISPTKEATESTRKLVESLADGALDKALDNIGFKSAKNFLDFKVVTDKTGTHLQSTFGKMMEEAKTTKSELDDLAIAFNAIGNVALEAMAIADEAAQTRHQNALNRLEKEKETALKFAGDSTAAKEKIETEYDKRKQELEKKEFKRQKKMALANIAINTAMGVMSVMSTGGGTRYADAGITAGILTAIVIGLGAVQAGLVLAQKPPEYWIGTDNAQAGLAYTQERGAELILDKNNRIKSFGSDGGAQLTMMEKGDKVKTASETKSLMFDSGLNSILSDNGIKEAKIEIINSGLTVDQMDSVLAKHFSNIQTNHTSVDHRGILTWSEKNGNKTIRNQMRAEGKGFRV